MKDSNPQMEGRVLRKGRKRHGWCLVGDGLFKSMERRERKGPGEGREMDIEREREKSDGVGEVWG